MARNDGKQTQAESLAVLERELTKARRQGAAQPWLLALEDGVHALRVKLRRNKTKAAYHKSPAPYATIVRGPRASP